MLKLKVYLNFLCIFTLIYFDIIPAIYIIVIYK